MGRLDGDAARHSVLQVNFLHTIRRCVFDLAEQSLNVGAFEGGVGKLRDTCGIVEQSDGQRTFHAEFSLQSVGWPRMNEINPARMRRIGNDLFNCVETIDNLRSYFQKRSYVGVGRVAASIELNIWRLFRD